MENQDNSPSLKDFVKKIVAIDIGVLLIAGVISLAINLNFSIILLAIGVLVGGLGVLLAGPRSSTPRYERLQRFHPNEKLSFRMVPGVKNSLPQYAFENAILFAGLIAIILSLPFICQIMF